MVSVTQKDCLGNEFCNYFGANGLLMCLYRSLGLVGSCGKFLDKVSALWHSKIFGDLSFRVVPPLVRHISSSLPGPHYVHLRSDDLIDQQLPFCPRVERFRKVPCVLVGTVRGTRQVLIEIGRSPLCSQNRCRWPLRRRLRTHKRNPSTQCLTLSDPSTQCLTLSDFQWEAPFDECLDVTMILIASGQHSSHSYISGGSQKWLHPWRQPPSGRCPSLRSF